MTTTAPSTARVNVEFDGDAIAAIIAEELAEVTPAMLEAGSAAALAVSTVIDPRGRRQPSGATTAQELSAIWRAMLAAKLAGSAP